MNNQVRRYYEFGDFRIDLAQRELQSKGRPVPLTIKAFDVLLALVENSGKIIEKEKLLRAIWPDTFVEEINLARNISTLRQALGDSREEPRYIETISRRGYRFIANVREVFYSCGTPADRGSQEPVVYREKIEPVGGAVPLDSNFYIVRPPDEEFSAAIARQDCIILIKGAHQMGKTSLLARGLQQARERGARVVLTDFQVFSSSDLNSSETLFLTLGNMLAEQLDLDMVPRSIWDSSNSANVNFGRYMKREVLKKVQTPIIWGLDEVDKLFTCDFGSEVFGLFRYWHNLRSLDPDGPWRYLTLAIAYATEAQLFIKDVNQSPFNVGTQLQLDDFTAEQVSELNRRYGSMLQEGAEIERFYNLVGGHPFLVRRGLYEMANGMKPADFEAQADRDDGPLGNHLRRILGNLAKDSALCDVVRSILRGKPCASPENFYRLRSAGVITGDTLREAGLRCRLYTRYLKQHLS